MHGARAGAPKGEANGSWKHGGWTDEAVAVRKAAGRLLKSVRNADPAIIEEARAKAERRKGQAPLEREPYTADELRSIMAYAKASVEKGGMTRAERKAANKAAWAAGDRSRWQSYVRP